MKPENYFDHAATTRLDPLVREAMLPFLGESFGNSESLHQWGGAAAIAVENAREQVSSALGAEDPSQIIFTSGATEANNWVVRLAPFAVSPFEHSSVREPAAALIANPDSRFRSQMLVSHETGEVFPLPSAQVVHRDITQAVGKVAVCLDSIDYASFSCHKFGGPLGVGALYVKDPASITPFHFGGGHESGRRAGTINVPGIVGLGLSSQLAIARQESFHEQATELRSVFLEAILEEPLFSIYEPSEYSPHILAVTCRGVLAEALVIECDSFGFGISAGAACTSHSIEPSPGLLALGWTEDKVRQTFRVSFGVTNTVASSQALAETLKAVAKKLGSS